MIQAIHPRRGASDFDLGGLDLNRLARDALRPWAEAYDSWRTGMDTLVRPLSKPRGLGCGCPACEPDPCACRCCVVDADLVVEARLLERRVVPIVIENPWRREREVELELTSWTGVGGGIEVRGEIATPTSFKLAPCGREEVVLLVAAAAEALGDKTPGKSLDQPGGPSRQGGSQPTQSPRRLPDVTRCEVAYADLRIKGCDMRSVRIAVAVLPRTCDAFTIDCGCACCC